MRSRERSTLVVRSPGKAGAEWNNSSPLLEFHDSLGSLRSALAACMNSHRLDVGRAIIDRAADAASFLDLLTALPREFHGDVMLIREHGAAVLSAMARGGARVLYALNEDDVQFYLETNDLVIDRASHLQRTA